MGIAEMLDELKQKAHNDSALREERLPPGRKHSPMPRSVRNAGSLDMRSMRWI